MRIAIDTGGTFTDCVALIDGSLKVVKILSTPADPSLAVIAGLQQLADDHSGARDILEVVHGTTVGTNAMLEQTGARVAFVTTAGFEDTIAIGRQARSRLYDWFAPPPVCLVPRELRFGVRERVSAAGKVLLSPSDQELEELANRVAGSGAEAVAISLLFAFANPETEQRVERALQTLGVPVSAATKILPEFREFERASTTVVNAYLAPRMTSYLSRLEERVTAFSPRGRVEVMQSSGGIIPARIAAREPVRTVLSGPAGGVIGACCVARWAGFHRIIGFDMGGTSTDVFLADPESGRGRLTRESFVAGVPIGIPMLDIHTAGAGGGSVARFDAGDMLRVGPESAGADPGPICFGRGVRPTVTDANFLLGRMDPDTFLGGEKRLDAERTKKILHELRGPLESAEQFAAGIVRVIESEMEKAIRVISIDRGQDPREFTLVAFGGGGPLHACSLARALHIPTVLIPAMPGALSAVGILLADTIRDYSRTVMLPGEGIGELGEHFAGLEQRGRDEFAEEGLEGTAWRTVDLRYRGQGYELNVEWEDGRPHSAREAFHELHRRSYGFADPSRPIEIVNVRLRMVAQGESCAPLHAQLTPGDGRAAMYAERNIFFSGRWTPSRIYRRDGLVPGDRIIGPAMVTEYTSATLLPPGDSAQVDGYGNLVVSVNAGGNA